MRSLNAVAEQHSSGVPVMWGCILALSLADCVWPRASDLKHLSFSFLSCKMGENNVCFPAFCGLNEINVVKPWAPCKHAQVLAIIINNLGK